tara:strand:+ start:1219 stop:1674 length:456 start_codon:yes stop_codon:yes gene_type:complete
MPGSTCPVCHRVYWPEETLSQIGFKQFDMWLRQLASLSFWRILEATDAVEKVMGKQGALLGEAKEIKLMKRVLNGKLDDRLRFEMVLTFKKVDGEGGGIQAAVFSPPFQSVEPFHDQAFRPPHASKGHPGHYTQPQRRHHVSALRGELDGV